MIVNQIELIPDYVNYDDHIVRWIMVNLGMIQASMTRWTFGYCSRVPIPPCQEKGVPQGRNGLGLLH